VKRLEEDVAFAPYRLEVEIDGGIARRTMDIWMNHCEKHINFKRVGTF
jgi:hypothetical protein